MRRYQPTMTALMNAALPASTTPVPTSADIQTAGAALPRGNRRTTGKLAISTAAVAPIAVIASSEGRTPTVELTSPTTRLPTGINPAVVR